MGDTCQASPDLRKSGFRQDRENGRHRSKQDKRALLDKTGEHCNKTSGAAAAGARREKEGGRRKAKTPLSENQIKSGSNKGDSQEGKIATKPAPERRCEKKDDKMKEGKGDFKDMTPEEQVLIVRHKLEKIIHGREKEENKAINLLKLLERINLTKSLIEATKIDLTLEAMNFTIKNPTIKERSKNLLGKIKLSVGSKPPTKIHSTEWRDPVKQAPKDKEDVSNEPVFSKLGFWMNKLMDTGKNLEVLDKQMENFSVTVKKAVPPPSKPARLRSKSPTIDELLDTKNNNNNKEVEGDLETLSRGLDKMLLEDKRKEDAVLKEKKKEEMEKEQNISDEIDQICASVTGVSLNSRDSDGKLFSEVTVVKTTKDSGKNSKENLDEESLTGRIAAGQVKEKLISIKTFLDTTGVSDKDSLMKHLEDLDSMSVTFDQLQNTKIGVSLNYLRKETVDSEILALSKKILRCWKKVIPKVPEKEPIMAVTENSQKKELNAEKAEDEIRMHFKKMLLAALKENKSLPERSWVSTDELAEAIEKAVFAMFMETSSKYRNQINSRVYNIKKNLTLQENLLIGNITPEEVAVMSHEEMASENLKKMRAELVKKGFEAVVTSHDPDDMFCTCRICLPPFLHA